MNHHSRYIGYLTLSFILLGSCFLNGCYKRSKTAAKIQSNWVSSNPLTVPFRVRIQQKDKGNLVVNGGFEQGKYFYFDTLPEGTFDIAGWKKVGNNVEWVDIKERYVFDSNEVSEGSHAIKIQRAMANETEDTGEGIISDFIKVIPGNYNLSLDIRLKNVHSHKARLGTKIYNAIDIRLIYYDKNKLEINSNTYSPQYQTNINTSFKGYPFSNFWGIDSLGWTRVFCKAANYPFPEGNIPDEARFIKVFLGLKGEGDMWVDNVDLRYTDYNFSIKELTIPFFNQAHNDLELLIPTPQNVEKISEIPLENDSVLLMVSTTPFLKVYADSIAKYLDKCCTVIRNNNLKAGNLGKYTAVISIGNTNLYQSNKSNFQLKNQPQHKGGYRIQSINGETPVMFINADDREGWYYAFKRFFQLVNLKSNVIYLVNIHDWPFFGKRGVIFTGTGNHHKPICKDYSLNSLVTAAQTSITDNCPPFVEKGRVVTLSHIGNRRFQMDTFIVFDEGKLSLQEDYNPYLPPLNSFQNNKRSILKANTVVSYNNWNNTEVLDMYYDKFDSYYRTNELFYSQSLAFSWTGPGSISYYIDETGFIRFKNYVKREVYFTDRTLTNMAPSFTGYAHHFIVPVYQTRFSDNLLDTLEKSIWFEVEGGTPFLNVSLATASGFAWNPESYKPWFTLYKVLINEFGRTNAMRILDFNDQYYKLKQLLFRLQVEHLNNRTFKTTEDYLNRLKTTLISLELHKPEMDYLMQMRGVLINERDSLFSSTKFIRPE